MEIKQDDSYRNRILFSYWLILLFGFPFWWFTTLVYRADLPYEQIKILELNKPVPEFKFLVKLHVSSEVNNELKDNKEYQFEFENELQDRSNGSVSFVNILKLQVYKTDTQLYKNSANIQDLVDIFEQQKSEDEEYSFYFIQSKDLKFAIENTVHMTSKRIGVIITNSFQKNNFINEMKELISEVMELKAKNNFLNSFTSLKLSPKYQVTFDLLISDDQNIKWSIKKALDGYLHNFMKKIDKISNFVVDSQILHFTSLKVKPTIKEEKMVLTENDLKHFVNAAEWNIASPSVSTQNVHFCVFVPSKSDGQLFIVDEKGELAKNNGFLFPQWGGVHIYNPQENQTSLSEEDLKESMEIFLYQFRELLGISRKTPRKFNGYHLDYSFSTSGVTDLELDSLIRDRTVGSLFGAISTLNSLVRLVEEIVNMQILDNIQMQVSKSLLLIETCLQELLAGNRVSGYLHAKMALELSEISFFDPKMVSLLYFPDDHKYAVYTPIFFPVVLPIVVSTFRILKERRERMRRNIQ